MAIDYSHRAREYDSLRADDAFDRDYWLRGLFEVGRIRPGDRVLDLGAGTGRFAKLLSVTSPVVAFDASREMLQVARGKGPFDVVQGDGHRLPFRADSFDVAILVMVLHQLADMGSALRDVARVSRRAALATVDMETRGLGILEEAFPSLPRVDRERFPRIPDLVAALKAAGFFEVRVEGRPYRRTFTVEHQLERIRKRYLSTFDLLPAGEYERGLQFLEAELPRRYGNRYSMEASFTFLAATK